MRRLSRRELLKWGAAGVAVGCAGGTSDPFTCEPVDWVLDTPLDELTARVEQALAEGTPYEAVHAAAFLATLTPNRVLDMHGRAALFSAFQLAHDFGPPDDGPVLWAVQRAAWRATRLTQPARSLDVGEPVAAAPEALMEALLANERDEAERIVAAACRFDDPAALRDPLTRTAIRRHQWIGHTAIHVAQAFRSLDRAVCLPPEEPLRALAFDITGAPTANVDAYLHNEVLADTLASNWADGGSDPAASLELFAHLRTATPESASERLVDLLGRGVGPGSIFDGVRLAVAELAVRFPVKGWALFAPHAVTSNNALRYLFDRTADDSLRRVLLLQAASFVPLHREMCLGHNGENPSTGWEFDALEAPTPTSLDAVFEMAETDRREAVASAAAWLNAGGDVTEFLVRHRAILLTKLGEEHQLKYPAAAVEEALWRPPISATDCWR